MLQKTGWFGIVIMTFVTSKKLICIKPGTGIDDNLWWF